MQIFITHNSKKQMRLHRIIILHINLFYKFYKFNKFKKYGKGQEILFSGPFFNN